MCRRLLQTGTPISSHKPSPPVASNLIRPTTGRHGPQTFPAPRNVARTSARPRGAEDEHILLTPHPRRRHDQSGYQVLDLSLIHISEPTRRYAISYAVFCLKKKRRGQITRPDVICGLCVRVWLCAMVL